MKYTLYIFHVFLDMHARFFDTKKIESMGQIRKKQSALANRRSRNCAGLQCCECVASGEVWLIFGKLRPNAKVISSHCLTNIEHLKDIAPLKPIAH